MKTLILTVSSVACIILSGCASTSPAALAKDNLNALTQGGVAYGVAEESRKGFQTSSSNETIVDPSAEGMATAITIHDSGNRYIDRLESLISQSIESVGALQRQQDAKHIKK